jgi:Rab5 GDP/GTP exchange factor
MSSPPTNPSLSHEDTTLNPPVEVVPAAGEGAKALESAPTVKEDVVSGELTQPSNDRNGLLPAEGASKDEQAPETRETEEKPSTAAVETLKSPGTSVPPGETSPLVKEQEIKSVDQAASVPSQPKGSSEEILESEKTTEETEHKSAEEISEKAAVPSIPESTPNATEKPADSSPPPPPPPPKDERFLESSQDLPDPPLSPVPPPKDKGPANYVNNGDEAFNEKYEPAEEGIADNFDDSQSEIQSIMEQFDEGMFGPGEDEIMSPRLEIAGPRLGSPADHPPRKSSLEPLNAATLAKFASSAQPAQQPPPRSSSLVSGPDQVHEKQPSLDQPSSPQTHHVMFKPTPPQPDPEPDLPFDFHRFLEQLRHRTADPVAKFLRSFLQEFGKKQWMVHEQVKIIGDFLEFITKKMAQCEVWRTVSEQEFDNAREGMEKLVMNRLYTQTFSPAIAPAEPDRTAKGRRKGPTILTKPGRRGQHQEDVERDEVLAQKVRIYKWVQEEHLDIKPVGEKGRKFLLLAQQGNSQSRCVRKQR